MVSNKYKAFIKVAELGSITNAAKELGYSQPGISHMIDALEKEFGFPLFIRGKDKIQITNNGEKVLYDCYQLIQSEGRLKSTVASINGLSKGSLRIAGLNSILISFVPKAISEFTRTYSNIDIVLQEEGFDGIARCLEDGSIDAAFTGGPIPRGFEFHPLFDDPIGLVMSKEHPFSFYDKVSIDLLNGCDFIMPRSHWDDMVDLIFGYKDFTPNVKCLIAGDNAGIGLAANNVGVFVISKLQTPRLPDTVVFKEFQENICRHTGIALKSLKHASPALKEFVKITQNYATNNMESFYK